jgi:beta-phosphoglucomutase-like phosphatase (HAD superfamily)
VVVEDAALGVEAAHAAGMKAIGLASTGRTRPELAAADLVVDRLDDITVLLMLRVREASRGA